MSQVHRQNRKCAHVLRGPARIVAEALESRTLLSASLSGTTLNVTGTSGTDRFTLSDDGATITVMQGSASSTFADSLVSKIVVNPSAGGDTVNLLSNTKPVSITGGGLDTVNIGGGSTVNIKAAVSVANSGFHTALTIDDSQDTAFAAANPTVSSSKVTGVASAVISYTASQLDSLNVVTQYDFTVLSTGVLGLSGHTVVTNLAQSGNVVVAATTGPLDVFSSNTQVGTGNTQSIQGAVVTNSDMSANGSEGVLSVDDSADTVGRTVTIGQSGYLPITGLSPALINVAGDTTAFLNVVTGSGNDTFLLYGFAAHESNINGGNGNNTFIAEQGAGFSGFGTTIAGGSGNDSLTINGIDSDGFSLVYDGGGGTNSFNFDDSADTQDQFFGISDGGFGGAGGGISFVNVSQGSILCGSGNDIVGIDSASAIAVNVHGGAGDDTITGGNGNDTLFGDDGNDVINGGGGNDSLNGGIGTDVLTGGTGIDTLDNGDGDGSPIQIVADNIANAPSNGSQGVTVTGNWISSISAPSFYGTNYINDNNSLKGTKSVTWTPNIPLAGSYQVYARWPGGANRATDVPFTMKHQGVSTTVIENQQTNDNAWVLLGTFALNAGASSSVTVSNTGTNGYVIADAVRFVPISASATLSGTTLNVNGTGSTDISTLSDDGTTITLILDGSTFTFADSSVSKIVVNPSAGGDTVNVLSNTKPIAITGGGLDSVNIGDNETAANIKAAISVANSGSHTALFIDDSLNDFDFNVNVIMSSSTVSGLSGGATISYTASQLDSLTVQSQSNITVVSTGLLGLSGHTVATNPSDSGAVTVLATTGPLDVNSVNTQVGAGSTQAILGAVSASSDASTTGPEGSLFIDDSADTVGRIVTIGLGGYLPIIGLSPAPIRISGGSLTLMGISTGSGNDRFLMYGLAAHESDINGGDGNNTFITEPGAGISGFGTTIAGGSGNDSLTINGIEFDGYSLIYDGGGGTNSFNFNDSADTQGEGFGIGSSRFVGAINDGISLANVSQASIFCGSGNDTVDVDPASAISVLIHGGAGDDSLTGGSQNDSIYGDAGNDTLIAGGGNDSLNGGSGTDVLTGGTGIDTLDGGDGLPAEIIADDIASVPVNGSEGVTVTGNWISSTTGTGFYGTDYINDNNSLKGTKNVKFTPAIPSAGSYQVYARWTAGANRASNVPFSVTHQGITSTVIENEQTNNNTWVLLGTFTLNAGTGSSVTVSNTGTTGYVIADAVRFVPVVATASISGTVFNDANGNGALDTNEIGVAGRVVYIDSNKDGVLDNSELQTTTDAGGNWSFTGLSAGTYRIREKNTPGVLHTEPPFTASLYDIAVTTGSTASAIYGKLFGEEAISTNPAPIFQINAGGPAFVLNTGVTFGADTGFTGGIATTTVYDVAGTDNDPLYYSYRSGSSFSYKFNVPNGNYSLILNFADATSTAAGQRKFNVTAQGASILSNFDLVATGGAKTAVTKTFNVSVTNGILSLRFNGVVGNAIVSGIQLFPV